MTYESDGVASLQWVGTVPAARGAGLGALVTVAATNLAFEHGASSCTLQASPMGESVYRRLGYETIYHYAEYVRWPTAPRALNVRHGPRLTTAQYRAAPARRPPARRAAGSRRRC